jgi:hypothetical protein
MNSDRTERGGHSAQDEFLCAQADAVAYNLVAKS